MEFLKLVLDDPPSHAGVETQSHPYIYKYRIHRHSNFHNHTYTSYIYIYIHTTIRSYTCDISHTHHKITSEILLAVHILFPFNEITPVIDPAGTAPGIFFGLSSILWTVAIADSIRRHLDGYGPARRWEEPPCGDV